MTNFYLPCHLRTFREKTLHCLMRKLEPNRKERKKTKQKDEYKKVKHSQLCLTCGAVLCKHEILFPQIWVKRFKPKLKINKQRFISKPLITNWPALQWNFAAINEACNQCRDVKMMCSDLPLVRETNDCRSVMLHICNAVNAPRNKFMQINIVNEVGQSSLQEIRCFRFYPNYLSFED